MQFSEAQAGSGTTMEESRSSGKTNEDGRQLPLSESAESTARGQTETGTGSMDLQTSLLEKDDALPTTSKLDDEELGEGDMASSPLGTYDSDDEIFEWEQAVGLEKSWNPSLLLAGAVSFSGSSSSASRGIPWTSTPKPVKPVIAPRSLNNSPDWAATARFPATRYGQSTNASWPPSQDLFASLVWPRKRSMQLPDLRAYWK